MAVVPVPMKGSRMRSCSSVTIRVSRSSRVMGNWQGCWLRYLVCLILWMSFQTSEIRGPKGWSADFLPP